METQAVQVALTPKKGWIPESLRIALTPFGVCSKKVMTIIVMFEIALGITLWLFQPYAVLPSPLEVLQAWVRLWNAGLAVHFAVSFMLNLEALALSTFIALSFAYLSALPLISPVSTFLIVFRFIGMTGLSVIFTLMLGGGHELKLWMLVFIETTFFLAGMRDMIKNLRIQRLNHARTLRMGEWRVLWEVGVLGTLDSAFDVLRMNFAMGWMALTMVEGISRSEGGIGVLMLDRNKGFQLPEVYACQLSIILFGLFVDYLIGRAKRAACPYASLATGRR